MLWEQAGLKLYITYGQSEISSDNLKIWPGCPMDNLIFNPNFERCQVPWVGRQSDLDIVLFV